MWPAKLDHLKHFDSIYSTKHLSTQYTTTPIHMWWFCGGEHPTRTEHSHPIDSSQACSKSWYFEKIYGFKCNHQMLIETAISDLDQNQILGFWALLVIYIFSSQIPVPTLITRPKLILNAEPLVAIYMQVLVVLFNLPVHVSNYHNCSWSCCLCNLMGNISVLLYKQNGFLKTWKIKRHIRCAFSTTGEWLTIFWKYG